MGYRKWKIQFCFLFLCKVGSEIFNSLLFSSSSMNLSEGWRALVIARISQSVQKISSNFVNIYFRSSIGIGLLQEEILPNTKPFGVCLYKSRLKTKKLNTISAKWKIAPDFVLKYYFWVWRWLW